MQTLHRTLHRALQMGSRCTNTAVPASTAHLHFALPCSAIMDILHPHITPFISALSCTVMIALTHSPSRCTVHPPSRLALTLPGPGALYPSLCRGLNSNVALQSTVLQAPIFQLCNTLLDLLGILEVHSVFLYPFQCCISAALQPWLESSLRVSCSDASVIDVKAALIAG